MEQVQIDGGVFAFGDVLAIGPDAADMGEVMGAVCRTIRGLRPNASGARSRKDSRSSDRKARRGGDGDKTNFDIAA